MRRIFSPAAFKLTAAGAGAVLATQPRGAEPDGWRLNCQLGYEALLKRLRERQDLQMDDYPPRVGFHKKGPDSAAYYLTKPPHAAHPASFWYGKGGSCQSTQAGGCSYGDKVKFKNALGKYQGRGSHGC